MAWTIKVSSEALKSLKKLDKQAARRIRDGLKEIAELSDPRDRGKPLKGELSGFWRYRFGDYRAICSIEDEVLVILLVDAGHRREIYRKR